MKAYKTVKVGDTYKVYVWNKSTHNWQPLLPDFVEETEAELFLMGVANITLKPYVRVIEGISDVNEVVNS